MAVVVDTDVVSFVFKKDTRSSLYEPHLDGEFMILSFMALAELRLWSAVSNWGARRKADFEIHLRRYSIHHSTPELCQIWSEIKNKGKRTGLNIDTADAWIAAPTLFFQVLLMTHNAADFLGI